MEFKESSLLVWGGHGLQGIGVLSGKRCIFLVQRESFSAISHYVFNECHPSTAFYIGSPFL